MTIDPKDRLTFRQIANFWPAEPTTYPFQDRLDAPLSADNRDDAARAVLQELVGATWRGEFEPRKKTLLALSDSPGVTYCKGELLDLEEIGRGKPEWHVNPLRGWPGERETAKMVSSPIRAPTTTPPLIEFSRDDLREGLKQANWCPPEILQASHDVLANLPISYYPAYFRETCLEALSIAKVDFCKWCKRRHFAPPAFARKVTDGKSPSSPENAPEPEPIAVPAAPAEKTKSNRGRKLGSGSYDDDTLLEKIHEAVTDKENPVAAWKASNELASHADGDGTIESKAKRLFSKYRKKYG